MITLRKQSGQHNFNAYDDNFVSRMLTGLTLFTGNCHVILSENDLTADEFKLLINRDTPWRKLLSRRAIIVNTVTQANHTFSMYDNKQQLATIVCNTLVR
jgi:hypothetical protein